MSNVYILCVVDCEYNDIVGVFTEYEQALLAYEIVREAIIDKYKAFMDTEDSPQYKTEWEFYINQLKSLSSLTTSKCNCEHPMIMKRQLNEIDKYYTEEWA